MKNQAAQFTTSQQFFETLRARELERLHAGKSAEPAGRFRIFFCRRTAGEKLIRKLVQTMPPCSLSPSSCLQEASHAVGGRLCTLDWLGGDEFNEPPALNDLPARSA